MLPPPNHAPCGLGTRSTTRPGITKGTGDQKSPKTETGPAASAGLPRSLGAGRRPFEAPRAGKPLPAGGRGTADAAPGRRTQGRPNEQPAHAKDDAQRQRERTGPPGGQNKQTARPPGTPDERAPYFGAESEATRRCQAKLRKHRTAKTYKGSPERSGQKPQRAAALLSRNPSATAPARMSPCSGF